MNLPPTDQFEPNGFEEETRAATNNSGPDGGIPPVSAHHALPGEGLLEIKGLDDTQTFKRGSQKD